MGRFQFVIKSSDEMGYMIFLQILICDYKNAQMMNYQLPQRL